MPPQRTVVKISNILHVKYVVHVLKYNKHSINASYNKW